MTQQFNLDAIIDLILDDENATRIDIDQDALNLFKKQCEYVDVIASNYTGSGNVAIDFDINKEHDIVVSMTFNDAPPTHLMAYKMLRMCSLDDQVVHDQDVYKIIVVLGTFLKN